MGMIFCASGFNILAGTPGASPNMLLGQLLEVRIKMMGYNEM